MIIITEGVKNRPCFFGVRILYDTHKNIEHEDIVTNTSTSKTNKDPLYGIFLPPNNYLLNTF